MQPHELKRILTAFANTPSDVDVRQGKAVAQIQDEIIDVKLERDSTSGELVVIENDLRYPPLRWVYERVAKLQILADRILTFVTPTEPFVTPSGSVQNPLVGEMDAGRSVTDVVQGLHDAVDTQQVGTTSVIYLTSDAGEGKTTVINQLARSKADAYKKRSGDTLLIPIPLGGKAFLHFDDVVIATLVNRFRFNYYYYEGFLELVRLGALIPAFDGFEEMFIEGSSGEAVSALGNLVNALDSSGTVIVAARKAFFEYQSFRTQARLFDSVGDKSVAFSRIAINRWGKSQFLAYADQRGATQADEIYELVASRFNSYDHPLLTRAVLVRRLFDIVSTLEDTQDLLRKLGTTPQDYFFTFVNALVTREANEKWPNKAGDAQEPLLTVVEHHELLSQLAREMWHSNTYSLRHDIVDVIVDLFCDTNGKSLVIRRQIKERIRQHSLLVAEAGKTNALRFDHDDFRLFYLGEALGRSLASKDRADLLTLFSANQLPAETCDQALQHLRRTPDALGPATHLVLAIARSETSLSYAKENSGALLVRLLDSDKPRTAQLAIDGMTFPVGAMASRSFTNIIFKNCYFQPTSIDGTVLSSVEFRECEFERLEMSTSISLGKWRFAKCSFSGLIIADADVSLFGPNEIRSELLRRGAQFMTDGQPAVVEAVQDSKVRLVDRFLRLFLRMTQVDEQFVRIRIGRGSATEFFDEVLPPLMKAGIVEEVPYRGSGVQRRFRLSVKMQTLQEGLASCEGSFSKFLSSFAK